MHSVTLYVPNISCGHCAATIKKSLAPLPGVSSVEVDIRERMVTVDYDGSRINVHELGDAIARAGYPADSLAGWSHPAEERIAPRFPTAPSAVAESCGSCCDLPERSEHVAA
ncbi:MAG: heavy-metal-associated domain-containing protein [Dehalococcoidia bacterium]|nr:heavy-metal-associated domain-containing protein [Dehalococcoidia bacterium]